MRNIKLTIEYDGTNYHGWQSQINAIAVQDVVARAANKLTGEEFSVTGASRTDVGVHALGQVANFHTKSGIPADRFSYALNSCLPEDIIIRNSIEVDEDFHSRFSAVGKKYRYLILNASCPSALLRNRAFFVPYSLELEAMQGAAQYFLGTHDFAAFRAAGSSVKTTERTITQISVNKWNDYNGDIFEIEVAGNGFLYNMVRIIAGTLVEIGTGKKKPEEVQGIIESRERVRAGATAPPQGLYLVEVNY
jgi:tRNA pseudouridine38-40 synthase